MERVDMRGNGNEKVRLWAHRNGKGWILNDFGWE